MRVAIVGLSILLFVAAPVGAANPPARITGETKYPPHSLVRLRADGADPKAAILWRVNPAKDVQRATSPRGVLEFAAHPGTYEIEMLVIRQTDGGLVVEESQITVVVAGCGSATPKPEPKPPGKANAEQAIGKLRFANAGCTATVIGPKRSDGKWDILTRPGRKLCPKDNSGCERSWSRFGRHSVVPKVGGARTEVGVQRTDSASRCVPVRLTEVVTAGCH